MEENIGSYRTRVFLRNLDNANESINIPIEVKNNIYRMAMEQ